MTRVMLRLVTSLTLVCGLWVLLWAPLASGDAAEGIPPERALGDADAPVTIVEYASLTCPACAAFHTQTLPDLKERYIETGQVRLIYRDFPLDQQALTASAIAHCAGEDRFFGFLEVFYQSQERWARAGDPLAALKQLARLGGLQGDAIDACLADDDLIDGILQMRLDAQDRHGVGSTPSFLVNGQLHVGNRDIDGFAAILDPLLD